MKTESVFYRVKRMSKDGQCIIHYPHVSLDIESARDDANEISLKGFKARIFKVTEIEEEVVE